MYTKYWAYCSHVVNAIRVQTQFLQDSTKMNITKMLAKKYQNFMAYNWEAFNHDRIVLGPGKNVCVSDLNESCTFLQKQMFSQWSGWSIMELNIILPPFFFSNQVNLDLPVFYKIRDIIVRNECVLLVTLQLKTVCFDEHHLPTELITDPAHLWKCLLSVNSLITNLLMCRCPMGLIISFVVPNLAVTCSCLCEVHEFVLSILYFCATPH